MSYFDNTCPECNKINWLYLSDEDYYGPDLEDYRCWNCKKIITLVEEDGTHDPLDNSRVSNKQSGISIEEPHN